MTATKTANAAMTGTMATAWATNFSRTRLPASARRNQNGQSGAEQIIGGEQARRFIVAALQAESVDQSVVAVARGRPQGSDAEYGQPQRDGTISLAVRLQEAEPPGARVARPGLAVHGRGGRFDASQTALSSSRTQPAWAVRQPRIAFEPAAPAW